VRFQGKGKVCRQRRKEYCWGSASEEKDEEKTNVNPFGEMSREGGGGGASIGFGMAWGGTNRKKKKGKSSRKKTPILRKAFRPNPPKKNFPNNAGTRGGRNDGAGDCSAARARYARKSGETLRDGTMGHVSAKEDKKRAINYSRCCQAISINTRNLDVMRFAEKESMPLHLLKRTLHPGSPTQSRVGPERGEKGLTGHQDLGRRRGSRAQEWLKQGKGDARQKSPFRGRGGLNLR